MYYRIPTDKDIDFLVSKRLQFLEVDETMVTYNQLKHSCYLYFQKALADDTCDVILAEDNGKCIGTGIIFFYDSVPSIFNIAGKNAYITSLYVEPDYRHKGIGRTIVEKLIEAAATRGYQIIMLNASDMGKPMYQKLGFVEISNGMILNRDNP